MISQREARRLKKRVAELEAQENTRRSSWAREYPGGVCIDTITATTETWHIVNTARKLGHAVVVVPIPDFKLHVYGLKLAK